MQYAQTVIFRSYFVAFVSLTLTIAAFAQDVGIGDKRDDVLRRFGKPSFTANRGGHEIFQYPNGGRIVVIDGHVTEVRGPLPAPIVETPPLIASDPADAATVPTDNTGQKANDAAMI